MTAYDALVLTGGAARRMGGRDKPAALVGGRSLLDRVLDAVGGARTVVVVGPECDRPGVRVTREQPPGAGPVAAIAAGLALVSAPLVAVLAGDLPFVTPPVVDALRAEVEAGGDGALLVDGEGRAQLLLGVWRTQALRAAVAAVGDPAGVAVRRLVADLDVRRVSAPTPGTAPPWWDCDTDADLRTAEEWTRR